MRNRALWDEICSALIEIRPGIDRLGTVIQRDCGLTAKQYELALSEYRRFLYLLIVTGENLRPSPVVEYIWELHSTFPVALPDRMFSLSVWPPKFVPRDWSWAWDRDYGRTLALYVEEFGTPLERKVWPSSKSMTEGFFGTLALFVSVPTIGIGASLGGIWLLLMLAGVISILGAIVLISKNNAWGYIRDR
jgi:hypothetical protein